MAGYIVGAMNGADAFPKKYLDLINSANGMTLEKCLILKHDLILGGKKNDKI